MRKCASQDVLPQTQPWATFSLWLKKMGPLVLVLFQERKERSGEGVKGFLRKSCSLFLSFPPHSTDVLAAFVWAKGYISLRESLCFSVILSKETIK